MSRMTPEQFKKYIANMKVGIRASNRRILKIACNEAARLFRKNFEEEGFFGDKWEEVNRRKTREVTYKTPKGKTKTKTVKLEKGAAGSRKILHGQGRNLSRSIKVEIEGNQATVYSDLPYSAAHNEGTDTAGRNHNVKIPQRQFIGEHPTLTAELEKKIQEEILKPIIEGKRQ